MRRILDRVLRENRNRIRFISVPTGLTFGRPLGPILVDRTPEAISYLAERRLTFRTLSGFLKIGFPMGLAAICNPRLFLLKGLMAARAFARLHLGYFTMRTHVNGLQLTRWNLDSLGSTHFGSCFWGGPLTTRAGHSSNGKQAKKGGDKQKHHKFLHKHDPFQCALSAPSC